MEKCPQCTHGPATMVEIRGVYDGGLFYHCDECKYSWHRWTVLQVLNKVAQPYIDSWNARHGFGE